MAILRSHVSYRIMFSITSFNNTQTHTHTHTHSELKLYRDNAFLQLCKFWPVQPNVHRHILDQPPVQDHAAGGRWRPGGWRGGLQLPGGPHAEGSAPPPPPGPGHAHDRLCRVRGEQTIQYTVRHCSIFQPGCCWDVFVLILLLLCFVFPQIPEEVPPLSKIHHNIWTKIITWDIIGQFNLQFWSLAFTSVQGLPECPPEEAVLPDPLVMRPLRDVHQPPGGEHPPPPAPRGVPHRPVHLRGQPRGRLCPQSLHWEAVWDTVGFHFHCIIGHWEFCLN